MTRWLVQCSFDGHDFEGWQRQPNKRTVQGEIEKVFSQIFNHPIAIHGASRTDAKVHALKFYFHVDLDSVIPTKSLLVSLNRMLPKDIHIITMKKVNATFHARNQPSLKAYVYRLHLKEDPFLLHYSTYYYYPFHLDIVQAGIQLFQGTHRFHQFTIKPDDRYDFERTIQAVNVIKRGQHIQFVFIGNGFMTHMVRMMVGSLLALNEGKITLAWLSEQFIQTKRLPVSFKAPPQGLYLKGIQYE
jgi:tRNA pseudouridine38-40 synthase